MTFSYCSATERNIAKALVRRALERGCRVSVFDGEETVLKQSANEKAIFEAMNSTECDVLRFWQDGENIGFVTLIWGNEEDLISDYSDNAEMEQLVG